MNFAIVPSVHGDTHTLCPPMSEHEKPLDFKLFANPSVSQMLFFPSQLENVSMCFLFFTINYTFFSIVFLMYILNEFDFCMV